MTATPAPCPREPVLHCVKCWPEQFAAVVAGTKTHEVRVNDRNYRVGDMLCLQEWDPKTEQYTKEMLMVNITAITPGGSFGLPDNMCCMSICAPQPATLAPFEKLVDSFKSCAQGWDDEGNEPVANAYQSCADRLSAVVEEVRGTK